LLEQGKNGEIGIIKRDLLGFIFHKFAPGRKKFPINLSVAQVKAKKAHASQNKIDPVFYWRMPTHVDCF
jgi:hypothetical protein